MAVLPASLERRAQWEKAWWNVAGLPLRGMAPRHAMLAANAEMRDTVTDVLALVRAERRRNK